MTTPTKALVVLHDSGIIYHELCELLGCNRTEFSAGVYHGYICNPTIVSSVMGAIVSQKEDALLMFCETPEMLSCVEAVCQSYTIPEHTVLFGCNCNDCGTAITDLAAKHEITFIPITSSFLTSVLPALLS